MIRIDLGHIIAEIPQTREEGMTMGSWFDFNKLAEKEGFRFPALKELGYLYSLRSNLSLGITLRDWYWSSEANQRSVYDSQSKFYFFNFNKGVINWEYGNEKTCYLIRIYEK